MANKFKTNLAAIMAILAQYQECHYNKGCPLEHLKVIFEQFTEGACEPEFYAQTAKLGGYSERELYELIATGLTNKTTKKGCAPTLPQIVAYVNSIVTPLQAAKQFANTISKSGQMAVTEYELCNFANAVEQFEQFYIKEALALTHVMQKELIKIAKKRCPAAWGRHYCLFNNWGVEFAVKTLLAYGWQKGQAEVTIAKLEV